MNDTPEESLATTPLFALLRAIERDLAPAGIDRVWVFPPRRFEAGETAVVVVSAYLEDEPERRRVLAAHYTLIADSPEPRLTLDEVGTAPADRVGRVVEDVLERARDAPTAAPRVARVEGEAGAWHLFLHELAEDQLKEAATRPRRDPRPRLTGKNFRPRGRT